MSSTPSIGRRDPTDSRSAGATTADLHRVLPAALRRVAHDSRFRRQDLSRTVGNAGQQTVSGPLHVLGPSGLGGCFEADGIPRPWDQLPGRQPENVARVLWWAIRNDPIIVHLRELFVRAVGEMGLPFPSGDPFSPHVTLGSAGPAGSRSEDFALWDVHTLPKGPNISTELAPRELRVECLHLTSVAVHPASLVRVAQRLDVRRKVVAAGASSCQAACRCTRLATSLPIARCATRRS